MSNLYKNITKYRKNVNILNVQKLMRHADIRQTVRYAHLAPEYLQEDVDTLVNWTKRAPGLAPSIGDSLQ